MLPQPVDPPENKPGLPARDASRHGPVLDHGPRSGWRPAWTFVFVLLAIFALIGALHGAGVM